MFDKCVFIHLVDLTSETGYVGEESEMSLIIIVTKTDRPEVTVRLTRSLNPVDR